MSVKTTVILLVALIVCLGYIVFFHTDWFSRRPTAVKEAGSFLTPEVGRAQRLVLVRPGSPRIVFVRRNGKWHLAEPVDAPADGGQVNDTLRAVATLRYMRKYAPEDPDFPKDDLTYLSAPLRTVTFTDDKDVTRTLRVGRNEPLCKRTYVQLDGDDHVYVVDTDLIESLRKTANEYRQTRVAEFDTGKAVRVHVRGERSYRLIKLGGEWSLHEPIDARADQQNVLSLLRNISQVSAEKFVNDAPTAEDLAGYGLGQPRLAVTVELAPPPPPATTTTAAAPTTTAEAGETITVAFGNITDEKVFFKLADRPAVYQAAESVFKNLQHSIKALRDKRVLDMGYRPVERVEVSLAAGGSVTLARAAREQPESWWRMVNPFAGPADDDAVDKLLSTLRSLEAGEFFDNPATYAAFGLAPPVGKIVLHYRGSDKTTALLLGQASPSAQKAPVRDAAGKSVAVVKATEFATLLRPAAAYWPKTIAKLPAEATVTRVDLVIPDRNSFTIEQDEAEKPRLTRPVAAPADADNAEAMLGALKTVKADKIIALSEKLPPRFAQMKPITVTLKYRKPMPATQPATAPTTAPATRPIGGATTRAATLPSTRPTTQPRFTTHRLGPLLAAKETVKGKRKQTRFYVWRSDVSPVAVGELGGDLYQKLTAEMRDRTVLKIDADKAASFKMVLEKVTLEFIRAGEQWQYTSDALVKRSASEVKEFLSKLSEIKADRFVDYGEKPDLGRFGLAKPSMTIEVKMDSGRSSRLLISRAGPVGTKDHYAASSDVDGVFVLSRTEADTVRGKLTDLSKGKDEGKD